MTKRIVSRDKISQATIEGILKKACVMYSDNNPVGTPEVSFLAGCAMALKLVSELDVPWIARNIVSDAGDAIGKEAIRRRDMTTA